MSSSDVSFAASTIRQTTLPMRMELPDNIEPGDDDSRIRRNTRIPPSTSTANTANKDVFLIIMPQSLPNPLRLRQRTVSMWPAAEKVRARARRGVFRRHVFFYRMAIAKPSRWSRVRQAEGRRRKSDLRTQPVIDAEARLGTRFARLGSLQNASPAYAAVMAKHGYLSDVRKPSRAWSRTRAPR